MGLSPRFLRTRHNGTEDHVRKVKITLKEGSTGHKFFLFPSEEALYVWACALERNENIVVDGIEELVLEPGGFIEAELMGYVYIYDSETSMKHKRLDLVRLGKAHQTKNASGLEASTHMGWVLGNMLPMKRYSDAHIDVVAISHEQEELDLPALFEDEIPVVTDE
jgi:hypothetical protein